MSYTPKIDLSNSVVAKAASELPDYVTQFRMLVSLVVKSGRADDFKALFESVIAPSQAEAGCVMYQLSQDAAEDHRFFIWEEWHDLRALDAHFKTAHMRPIMEGLDDLLAEQMVLTILRLVD